ncbi:MAG: protoheme IX farnesyltransferase [Gammaproteobacteria bacterium]|nr:MAG: protoheme IX farnesyltransferase [Gammaproteobacteria bacterium]
MNDQTAIVEHPPKWREYYELCKPKVIVLIIFTAVVGMLLAVPGALPLGKVIFATLGIGMAAASGAAINQLVEQRIDAMMARTKNRPLPQGELNTRNAFIFALLLCAISMVILVYKVNTLTALLTFISLIGYAVIYTMFLKPATPQNIVLGGAAGAAPPLLGWVAMTGEVSSEALLLFLIIFIWTPPHFWALAIRRREEYASVGIPMLPVTHGVPFTKLQILLYTILLLAVSVLPFVIHMSGLIYLAGAIALGLGFIWQAFVLYRSDTDEHAMKTFGFSIFYLSVLFGFFLLDHYARIFLRHFFI